MQILDDLKFQLEGKKAEDLQKFFGKPKRSEGNVWIYTGLKMQSTDEKFRSVLRVSLTADLLLSSTLLTNKKPTRQGLKNSCFDQTLEVLNLNPPTAYFQSKCRSIRRPGLPMFRSQTVR